MCIYPWKCCTCYGILMKIVCMINEYLNKVTRLYLVDGRTMKGIVKLIDSVDDTLFCLIDSVNAFSDEKYQTINIPSVEEIELLEYPVYEIE